MFFKKERKNLLSPAMYDSVQIGKAFFSLYPLQQASCLFLILHVLGGTALSNRYEFKLLSHIIQILLHKQRLMQDQTDPNAKNDAPCKCKCSVDGLQQSLVLSFRTSFQGQLPPSPTCASMFS